MTPADMAVMWDDSMNAAVQMYAQDNGQFLTDFGALEQAGRVGPVFPIPVAPVHRKSRTLHG
jgi:hypothetical protein